MGRRREVAWGQLDLLLLASVRVEPAHGYAIIDELRRKSRGMFDFTEGTIYPALHRLEDAGLIASRWSSVAGRRRRVYRLTAAGKAKLREQEAAWRSFSSAMNAALQP